MPTQFMRDFAEHNNEWKAHTCFTFLYAVLDRMRSKLESKPNGHRLTVSYTPTANVVNFVVHDALETHLVVSQKFWQQFTTNQ